MQYRLWFWSSMNPIPRIIAHSSGQTIREAMYRMFAPIGDKTWEQSIEGEDVYLRRKGSGYCGQLVVEGELPRKPRGVNTKPRFRLSGEQPRKRLRL